MQGKWCKTFWRFAWLFLISQTTFAKTICVYSLTMFPIKMEILKKHASFGLLIIALFLINYSTLAAPRTASVSGNWSAPATWGGAAMPTSADDVTINSGIAVTVDVAAAACNTLTFAAVATSSSITISGANALTVTGLISMPRPATGRTCTIAVGAGSLTAGSLRMSATTAARPDIISISTGTVTINGTVTTGTTGCQFNFTGAGLLRFGGTFAGGPAALTPSTGTVEYTSATPVIQCFSGSYNNLKFSGSGTSSGAAAGNIIIQGDLSNTGGGTLNFTARPVRLSGTTAAQNIAGFTTTGLVSMLKTGGTATFTGNVNGAGLTINGGGGTLNLGAGLTHTFTGAWTRTSGTLNGGSSTMKIGLNITGTGGTFTAGTGTVECNRAGNQTIAATAFNNLLISGSGTKSMAGIVSVGGNLTVQNGTTFSTGNTNTWTLSVTGSTSVSGTLTLANTATKTFTGDVTVNSGGIWNETGVASINMAGSLQHSGTTFTTNTGIHTFSGTSKTIGGTLSIRSVTVTGTYTNNNTLTIATALAGGGALTNAATGILNLNFTGPPGITTLTATAGGNLVNYGLAGAQTIKATTYSNLTLSGSGAKTTTGATVNGILSMEGTATTTGTVATYGAASTLQYKGSALQTTGTEFPATFGGSGGVIINNGVGVNLGSSVAITNGLLLQAGTFAVGANTLTLNGPSITGTPNNLTTVNTSSLVFGGSSAGVQIPGSVTLLNNLTINNTNGVTLNSSPNLNGASGTLILTSGILNAGSFTIQAKSNSRSSGFVNGRLSLNIPAGAPTVNFYIGDAGNYTPVTLVFVGVVGGAGYIVINSTSGQHPNISTSGINYSLDVARYYTLSNSGTTFTSFSPTFTFVAGDVIGSANTNNFVIRRYGAAWANTTIGTRTSTSTQATGVAAIGDFAIGEPQALDHFLLVLDGTQTNGLAFTGTNTLTAQDISNNVVTFFDASADNVTITADAPLTTGAGAISGLSGGNILTNALDFISGVANLTSLGLKYTGVIGTGTFTATSVSGKTGTSGNVTIEVGDLVISNIVTQTAGTGFNVTITSEDSDGNPVNVTSNSLITLTLATGTGTLGGTLTGTILNGTNNITINGVTYSKAESGVSITATQSSGTPGLSSGTSNTFIVNPGIPANLSISNVATQTAGAGFSVTVTALDASGNPANVTSASDISLSKASGTGSFSGTLTGTIANGTSSITISGVIYNVAESGVSITATQTSGTPAMTVATSNTFLVVPDPIVSTLTPATSNIIANGSSTQILTVQAKDAAGTNLLTGGSTVTITKSAGTGTIGSITDNGNGTYTAAVTSPITTGSGTFVATMNGSPVRSGTASQTTVTVNYISGTPDASQSTLTPSSANIPDDGVTTQILTVQAIDVNGNSLTTGGATVVISKQSGAGNVSAVTDNGNGTYTATVTSSLAGIGIFVATIGGSPVMGGTGSESTSTITFTLGAANATASTLTPVTSTIEANGTSTQDLIVQAKDATGNNLITGGETVTITKQSGSGTIGSVTDNGDGTYTATVTSPSSTGNGVFIATLNGSQVKSGTATQTQATVYYGSNAAKSTLTPTAASITGDGVSTIDLLVQAKDINGIDIITGGETVTITKQSGTGTIGSVTDNGDGTYNATVTAPASTGSGVFIATLNGAQVRSGTATQTQAVITYAGPVSATQSILTPTSASIIANGVATMDLTVQANDASGNNLSTGGATVTITRLSGTGTISAVSDNLDGTYTATVTSPTATGNGIFVATLNGNPVRSGTGIQTQSTITYIPGPEDANQTTLTPTSASVVSCGSTQVLTVQTKDANGNNLTTGGATVAITIQSGSGSVSLVTDNGNGTYTATVTSPSPTTSGNGVFAATLGGLPIMSGTASQTIVTITYTPGFTVGISGGTSPICANINPGVLTATGSGGPGPITYLWYANGISTGTTTNTYDPGILMATSTFYCAVSSGSCGTINTSSTVITVIPNPDTGVTYKIPNNWAY